MKYNFRRDFYDVVIDSIENNSTTFLLGPRKCGKTICLKQINDTIENTKYIDFKLYNEKQRLTILDQVLEDIRSNKNIVYLLDEASYIDNYNIEICKIADAYTDLKNTNTKIVFSGSQSVALGFCANTAFAGNTNVISTDFLTYSEFLKFKNVQEVSQESYNKFLMEVFDFYDDFTSLKQYLNGCLNETIISNIKSSEIILGNETSLTEEDTDFLIDVCHQTLFNLHNHVNVKHFFANNTLQNDIAGYFSDVCKQIDSDTIAQKISESFIGSYNTIKSRDAETIRQALLFLKKCDLITITPITHSIENVPNIERNIRTGDKIIGLKDDLFSSFNINIKHPMFYVQILKDILGPNMPQKLPNQLLGSIVACHIRGLFPMSFELKVSQLNQHNIEEQKEIDLIDLKTSTATDLTISSKHKNHFDIIPNYFNRVMLTKDINSTRGGITHIPYYEYIYNLSECRYHNIKHDISNHL